MGDRQAFVLPPREVVAVAARDAGAGSYAIRNYYGNGPIGRMKRQRFERALRLARDRFGGHAIDFGAADGLLLPSLARHFQRVVGVDLRPEVLDRAGRLVQALELDNVQLICNRGLSPAELRQRIGDGYDTMFLLETLEHVGAQPDIWTSKIDFLRDCFDLLERDGRIIVSVPKMVGMSLLVKNLLQRSLQLSHDKLTFRQLLKSSILRDTDDLEPLWNGHHIGFNHLKLEPHLAEHFTVHHRSESAISVFYVLGR